MSCEQVLFITNDVVSSKRKKYIETDMKEFRHNQTELFWNIIFYMSNYGLPYDMFLPYKDERELEKIEEEFEMQNSSCIVHFNPDSNISKVIKAQKEAKEKKRMKQSFPKEKKGNGRKESSSQL